MAANENEEDSSNSSSNDDEDGENTFENHENPKPKVM